MKNILTWAFVLLLSAGCLTGCYQLGKAAGQVEKTIDNSAEQFEKGYDDGKKS